MNGRGKRAWRASAAMSVAVLGALGTPSMVNVAQAAESAASGAGSGARTTAGESSPPKREGLDASKREFETMKASRDPAQQPQKGALPRIGLPELHGAAGDAPRSFPDRKAQAATKAKNSANWLVDAMEKDAANRDERSERGERGALGTRSRSQASDERALRSGGNDGHEERQTADGLAGERRGNEARQRLETAERNREDSDKRKNEAPENPLMRYLGDWMTPRDYAVLRPGLEESFGARTGGALGSAGTDALSGGGIAMPGAETNAGLWSVGAPTQAGPMARENPYLAAMQAAESGTASVMLPPPLSAQTGLLPPAPVRIIAPAPPPNLPPPSKIPDFAKPAHDEKFFKQLKRF